MVNWINQTARRVPEWVFYAFGAVPFFWLTYRLFTGGLGVDPTKAVEHALGRYGLQFLIATLCVTPLRRFSGVNLLKFRRALGLLAFVYICLHLLAWLLLDIQLLWGQIWADILKRPYITIGMVGFILMIPLALTSNAFSVRKLGAKWRSLHKLTYVVAILGVAHFVMLSKGWQLEPSMYLWGVIALLVLRNPVRISPSQRLLRQGAE